MMKIASSKIDWYKVIYYSWRFILFLVKFFFYLHAVIAKYLLKTFDKSINFGTNPDARRSQEMVDI